MINKEAFDDTNITKVLKVLLATGRTLGREMDLQSGTLTRMSRNA